MIRSSILALVLAGCGGDPAEPPPAQIVGRDLSSALMSIWGTSETDVYTVGGDDGTGPLVYHFDGSAWTRLQTGERGNLWWIFGFEGGPIFMGGDGGMILRYEGGAFTRMTTPGVDTIFGIWGSSPTDVWAVGGALGGTTGGFAWRLQGDTWVEAPGLPGDIPASAVLWKIYGRAADDAFIVGTNGRSVRWDGATLTEVPTIAGESLFTVHADADSYIAVGGFREGVVLEHDGAAWNNVSPPDAPGFIGVHLSANDGYVVGEFGAVYRRSGSSWVAQDLGFDLNESFHATWVDPAGGLWLSGGDVLSLPLADGILVYRGQLDLEQTLAP